MSATKLTKNDMARVIVQALFALPRLPKIDHWMVVSKTRMKKVILTEQYKLAYKIITGHEVMGVK